MESNDGREHSRWTDHDERDARIDALVADYLDRLNEGEELDTLRILAENPELGSEVLRALQVYMNLESAAADDEPLGTLGDYTLRRQIGRGGMGVVYEAWQGSLDRQVALKVLPAGLAADTRATNRFLREAQVAAKLQHPQVVSVHGFGVEQNTPYYAMEYVEGETLAQILARIKDAEPETETPFGPKDQVDYFAKLGRAFADVADGLQHAHSKGVVHRDIKPSNLILDGEGRLRILDFGLARLEGQESLTLSGDFLGTPLYMSPEQARRRKIEVDHRTDVYSLGATMYEAICGRPPFRGKDDADTLSQIVERDPVELRKVNARVPKDLETIVLKCLRKDAGDRYGTAEALGQDLRRFVRGEVVEARAESRWRRVIRRAASSRRGVTRSALVILLLAGAVTVMHFLRDSRQPHASLHPLAGRFDKPEVILHAESGRPMGCVAISPDERTLYFSRWKSESDPRDDPDLYFVPATSPFQRNRRSAREMSRFAMADSEWASITRIAWRPDRSDTFSSQTARRFPTRVVMLAARSPLLSSAEATPTPAVSSTSVTRSTT